MFQEIRLHGHIDDTVEYFATAVAADAYRRFFFEQMEGGLRLFAQGNELVLEARGVRHQGNGGHFCEYMFGINQPLSDMVKGQVGNRLVLYGTRHQGGERLDFSDPGEGMALYDTLFTEGHALYNYLFFVSGAVCGPLRKQQEEILRLLGKTLKRSRGVGEGRQQRLIAETFDLLQEHSAFFLVQLVHKKNRMYHDLFHHLYHTYRSIPDPDFERLQQLAARLEIPVYQQERIRIDVMYKHPTNRPIADEYRNLLLDCRRRGEIGLAENARLSRLKTLAMRKKIAPALFTTLEKRLMKNLPVTHEEQDYLAETRQILEGLMHTRHGIDAGLNQEDILKILHAKKRALELNDRAIEQILLDAGRLCDERIRDGAPFVLREHFHRLLEVLNRFEETAGLVNCLAFMENSRLSEKLIVTILETRRLLDDFAPATFRLLLVEGILHNSYLGHFGRRKLNRLTEGLARIAAGQATVAGLLADLLAIDREEHLFRLVLGRVKERLRHLYGQIAGGEEREALRVQVGRELVERDLWQGDIPADLFRAVIVQLEKEALYLQQLLPRIIAGDDRQLREDFLANSGLDRFTVEELEREYGELNGIAPDLLQRLRQSAPT